MFAGQALLRQYLLLGALMLMLSGCKELLVQHFAFYPQKVGDTPALTDPGVSEMFLTTADGVRIHSLFFESPSAKNVLLFFHGNAGHAYHRYPDALALQQFGLNVMLVDYRGYGKSEGSPSEIGLYQDGNAALAYLLNERRFQAKNIFILGRSIGSTVAVEIAQHTPVAGLVLVTPITNAEDMAKSIGMGWLSWAVTNVFNNTDKINNIKSPILIIHGDRDEIIPYKYGVKLFDLIASQQKRFIRVRGAGHNNLTAVAGEDYWAWIAEFVKTGR